MVDPAQKFFPETLTKNWAMVLISADLNWDVGIVSFMVSPFEDALEKQFAEIMIQIEQVKKENPIFWYP